MDRHLLVERSIDRFDPLPKILTYDDFDRGLNGWLDLNPNFTEPGFRAHASIVDKSRWAPIMLSSATFPLAGTHGSVEGVYSLKLSTKRSANPYTQMPAPGSRGHAIKRLSRPTRMSLLQLEMWYAYTPEQDRIGLGEKDIRAFGMVLDLQDSEARYFIGARYLNAADGRLMQRWQYAKAADVSDAEWAYGTSGDWCRRGVDPMWFGRRYDDGRTDGFMDVPGGRQQLIYNESDDKINWLYLCLLADVAKREYVELQSGEVTYDLRGVQPTYVAPYARITGLVNPVVWIEADTDRRVFVFVDSILV